MGKLTLLFHFLVYFSQYHIAFSSSSSLSSSSFSSSPPHPWPLCRHDQRSALLQFKHTFTININASSRCDFNGVDHSYPKTLSWDENTTDCCNWDGVMCDGLTGHVIGLDLSCSQLYGTIHPNSSLFQLSHLQWLNLAYNNFSESRISYGFGRFASLTHLNLSYSAFSGSIPSEISYLSKLISLDLSSWQPRLELLHFKTLLKNLTRLQELILQGVNISSDLPVSVSNLTSLTFLDLSWTGLQGILPESIDFLKSLNYLDLSSCKLWGPIPNSLGNLTQLRELDLSHNGFNGEVPSTLSNLKQLTSLVLYVNNLEGRIPNVFSELKMLETFDLGANNFVGGFPLWVANLKPLIRLYIYSNQLTGPIPLNLSGLQNLRVLDLSNNSLSGVIPPWLFTLPSLETLSLHSNCLTGPIPKSISTNLSGLQNLQELYLYNNSLRGVIPPSLFTLPSLENLDLSSNCLTGQIPKFEHDLPLERIDLSDNKLHGPIPKSISTLVSLTTLSLSNTNMSGVVDLQRLKNLEILSLSNTNLLVIATSNVNNTFPNLRDLDMSSCNIEVFPGFLRTSENLQRLDLSNNRIHGQIPNWVMSIGKYSLQYLNLSHNSLTNIKQLPWEKLYTLDLRSNLLQGPLPIPPPSIWYFFISNNSLSGEIPSLICNASSLEILDLSHNNLSGAVPKCLGNFSYALSRLNLRSNGFEGTLPLAFAKHNNLRSLDLNGNQFEGPLPRSLTSCRSLELLNVGNNKINDTFPYWLGSLPELQVLVVRSNRFHGPLNTLMSKFSFPKLRIVDLSYNEFNGHLPGRYFEDLLAMKNNTRPDKQYMGDEMSYYHDSIQVTMMGVEIELVRILTIFTTIDFSSNNFSGEIPSVIGRLNSLIVLNFSHNSLTGHIPASFGDLTSLQSLDISSNQLTGRIPTQLANLTFLEVLNLSSNRLYGPIPHGPQFNTFENGSYAGNLGLCGFPMSDECEDNQTKVHPPVLQQQDDDPDFDGFTWKIVVIGYGCGMTLGLFLGFLMFLIGRPKFFVRLVEREGRRRRQG